MSESRRIDSILITGASRGIGFAMACATAPMADAIFLHARTDRALDAISKRLDELAPECKQFRVSADLADEGSPRAIADAVATHRDQLDVLVLNGGIYLDGDAVDGASDDFLTQLRVNLLANMDIAHCMLPLLKRGTRRRIVITGSTAGFEPYPGGAHYGITKWGLRGFAQNLRKELVGENIGVTHLAAGATATDMWADEELPEGRLLDPDDHGILLAAVLSLSPQAVVEEISIRSMLGDPH
ncbi:SDR family oxidoreductase [Candidatus Saccharibacteria bacterium]|nr:SDR family oxidoreductase [Candidatus Saccharibacteria bacterium]